VSSRLKPSKISWAGRALLTGSWLAGSVREAAFGMLGRGWSIVSGVAIYDYTKVQVMKYTRRGMEEIYDWKNGAIAMESK
jgi:hypothetical protein